MILPKLQNLGPFVGRKQELEEIRAQIEKPGFVTLVGPGGAGKTRLALESAGEHDGDVAAVWLDELRDDDDLPGAIASALGLASVGESDIERIAAELAGRQDLLLVIDNAEHVLGRVRDIVQQIPLQHVRVLLTSRVPLELPAEHLVRLGGLPPAEAGELLHARGAMLAVDVRDDAESELLDALDHLPLAIELAVARMAILSPAQILARLQNSNEVLGSRDPSRHGALDRTIAWSWEHLEPDERSFLTAFAMFDHAIDPNFLEELWPDRDVWGLAQSLQAKSWLQIATVDDTRRWATLRSIRRFLNHTVEQAQIEATREALAQWARRTTRAVARRRTCRAR